MLGRRHEIDMCNGPLLSGMIRYALPLILTNILQLLYQTINVMVVGRFAGSVALAAVGSTTHVINISTYIFLGMSVGVSVVVAQYFGARDYQNANKSLQTALLVAGMAGVCVTIFGILMARRMLTWVNSPKEVIDLSTMYLRVYFLGIPASLIYNFGAGAMRGMGDSRRPLKYLAVAGILNVCLNLFFVLKLNMSVAGVALATVISQYVSATLVVLSFIRSEGNMHLDLRSMRIYKSHLWEIVRIGVPAGVNGSLFALMNLILQSAINSMGPVVMAGCAASANADNYIYMAINAITQTNLAFTGQNVGAGKYDRVKKGIFISCGCSMAIALGMGATGFFFADRIIGLFTSDPAVVQVGVQMFRVLCATYFIYAFADVEVGAMRGMGNSLLPMGLAIIGVCAVRIIWIYTIFAANPQLILLAYSFPVSWSITLLLQTGGLLLVWRRLMRKAAPIPVIMQADP